jgi:ABC-2 type transport system permease protein
MKTITVMTQRIIPAIATRGRVIAMLLVGLSGIVIAILLRRADVVSDDLVEFVSRFGFTIFVPLVALVISTASLGGLVEDKTLVYFWLRPIGRWQISMASLLAGFIVLTPLILIPMGVLGAVAGTNSAITGALVGSAVGLIAYTSIFTMFGLFTQRALAWGLLYVLIWEGLIASFSRGAGWLAISTYTNGALSRITDVPGVIDNPPAVSTIIIVTTAIAATCFGITTWRLNTMTVD